MQYEKTPNLSLNHENGYYEGTLLVQVDAEIFKRIVLQALQEDETVNLTDPEAIATIIARVGKVTNWIGRPHTKLTPIALPVPTEVKQAQPVTEVKQQLDPLVRRPKPKTLMQLIEERLREKVRSVPPHLWDKQCRTPISEKPRDTREYDDVSRLRSDERKSLKVLYEEWQRGDLVLAPEAEEQEREHQASQLSDLNVKMESVADAVNGSRHH